jgi:hypothetical protein
VATQAALPRRGGWEGLSGEGHQPRQRRISRVRERQGWTGGASGVAAEAVGRGAEAAEGSCEEIGDRRHRGFAQRVCEFGGARAAGREGDGQGSGRRGAVEKLPVRRQGPQSRRGKWILETLIAPCGSFVLFHFRDLSVVRNI